MDIVFYPICKHYRFDQWKSLHKHEKNYLTSNKFNLLSRKCTLDWNDFGTNLNSDFLILSESVPKIENKF